ncbi:hypothetical protein AB1K70_21140 [Bremerella sp. JC770]|uniref:hypothetical protein n=1 Tax=Bremerella sp. JC770 TaxID=3232137 RepID=UPI00345A6ABA
MMASEEMATREGFTLNEDDAYHRNPTGWPGSTPNAKRPLRLPQAAVSITCGLLLDRD